MKLAMGLAALLAVLGWNVAGAVGQERWWNTGHAHITVGGVQHLPPPLLDFFAAQASTVGYYSRIEPPSSHWFHRNAYPESFPHDYDELVALYGEQYVQDNGVAPWNAAGYADYLTTLMAGAVTSTDWTNLLPVAGALAHYLEDLHNPLHTTTNYDGQETGNDGIHYRYEGVMISQHLADLVITPSPADCVYYDPNDVPLIDAIFASIDVTYAYVDDLLAADTAATAIDPDHGPPYYAALWAATGGFTQERFQDASEMVASAWYTAWLNAGAPAPVLPGIIGDLNCDATVDFADINPFVLYESNIAGWRVTFPGCDPLNGDINQDGTWGEGSFGDINPFVTLLVGDR
jgi:hypothetical protein